MSLRPQPPLPPVPGDTARVARAAFRRGNPCLLLRDRLGAAFDDAGFADLYPGRGQLAYAPWRLALVTLLQFRESLSDRQAAEAVRARIDWKNRLALELTDPGFDHSVLCEFRGRLLGGDAADRLPDQGWQKQVPDAIHATDFAVDWAGHRVRCPEGCESTSWGEYRDKASGRPYIRVGFSPTDCRPCPSRSRCTRAPSRRLGLHPRPGHEALAAARARQEGRAGRRLYAQRQGIEGTISQGVRTFGLRRARYRGLAKTGLRHVAVAAAVNLDRLAAWFAGRSLAPTRTSRFAALAA